MKHITIGLFIVAILVTGCHLLTVEYVSATYDGGMEFLGIRRGGKSSVSFFSVRVENENDQPITSACPLVLHWKGHVLPVHSVTPHTLRAAGIEVQPTDYKGPEWKFGFVGGGDQNRDFGIEFHIKGDRIVEFYARHNSSAPCGFQLSRGNKNPVVFPLSEDQLKAAFGEPKHIVTFPGT